MTFMRSFSCTLLAACCTAGSPLAAQRPSPGKLHELVVTEMARAGRLEAAADTFVSWTERGPVLYHLVTRWGDGIKVAMQRNDQLTGTATVRFASGGVRGASVQWSDKGKVLRAVSVDVRGDSVVVSDTVRLAFPRPDGAWAVADYGMDDLLVEAVRTLEPGREHLVRVYRPFGARWDSLTVRLDRRDGGLIIDAAAAPDDTSRFVVADDGTVVQELRSKYPANERRPLEETRAYAIYLRMRLPAKP